VNTRTQKNVTVPRLARAALCGAISAILLAGCASVEVVDPATVDGRVLFNAAGCPTRVVPNSQSACPDQDNRGKICKQRGKKVSWQSVDSSDRDKAIEKRYWIYFDPFKRGATIPSNGQGLAKATTDDKAPKVEYKYTIVTKNCDPLDPRLILD
jgi:hypothetical protein